MKSKNLQQSYNSKLEISLTSGFKLWLGVLHFSFLVFSLLVSMSFTGIANGQITSEQLDSTKRQLWQAKITIPAAEDDQRSKNQLKRIIEQIRAIKFERQNKTAEPIIVVEPVSATEPEQGLPDTQQAEEPPQKEFEPKLPYEPVTDQTLQMLKNLSQHPDQLDNPFQLAEVLFFSGHLKQAAVLYQEALNRHKADQVGSARDRAWILFQIGNCLRDDDPPTAKKMYRQLITEYPDSPWTDLAKARDKLIDWYQKDKPRELIEKFKYQK